MFSICTAIYLTTYGRTLSLELTQASAKVVPCPISFLSIERSALRIIAPSVIIPLPVSRFLVDVYLQMFSCDAPSSVQEPKSKNQRANRCHICDVDIDDVS